MVSKETTRLTSTPNLWTQSHCKFVGLPSLKSSQPHTEFKQTQTATIQLTSKFPNSGHSSKSVSLEVGRGNSWKLPPPPVVLLRSGKTSRIHLKSMCPTSPIFSPEWRGEPSKSFGEISNSLLCWQGVEKAWKTVQGSKVLWPTSLSWGSAGVSSSPGGASATFVPCLGTSRIWRAVASPFS